MGRFTPPALKSAAMGASMGVCCETTSDVSQIRLLLSHIPGKTIVFVGDSSMRIFFSALVSMVNGTREWDTPDPALSSWRIPYEPPERRASTCDNRLDEEHDVGLPCFREFSAHGVRLTFVWKTFLRDRPTPGRALYSCVCCSFRIFFYGARTSWRSPLGGEIA